MRAQQARLEDELRQAQDEHARVQQEIGLMQRDAETSWAAERMENALLRERINDIAAEVARLTVVLEGPDSPIEGMLANDNAGTRPEANGANGAPGANGGNPGPGTLADRIRALQSRASRLTVTS
jgi:hypothetical protein